MSDSHSHDDHSASATGELFEKSELHEFVVADQSAGRSICKLLSALFVYTVLAMSTAAIWTYYAISN